MKILKFALRLIPLVFLLFTNNVKSEIVVRENSNSIYLRQGQVLGWKINGNYIIGESGLSLQVNTSGIYTVDYLDAEGKLKSESVVLAVVAGKIRKVYVIGDSTASIYTSSTYPRTGWAQVFQRYFSTDSVQILDKALSGRSSKSYYTDASGWPVVKPLLTKGDFLFIQFAHNDEKTTDTARYTDPYTTFKGYLTKYITEARNVGAIPVLLTPICRNYWNSDTISIKNSHGNYPDAMRQLSNELNVPLLDLSVKTENLFESFGKYATTWNLFLYANAGAYTAYPTGVADDTHLQEKGAIEVAKLVADAIWESNSDTLRQYLGQSLLVKSDINSIKYSVSNPMGIGYITGPTFLPVGVSAKIKAVASSGFVFDRWEENANTYSLNNEITATGGVTRNLIAVFSSKTTQLQHINANENKVQLISDPINHIFTISSTEKLSEIRIFDIKGKCLETVFPLDLTTQLNLRNYKHGVYIIMAKSTNRQFTQNFKIIY